MEPWNRAAQRAILVLICMVAFVGLWQWLMPYRGPANTLTEGDTAETIRGGMRVRCPPAVITYRSDPLVDSLEKGQCLSVGVVRLQTGWMLLLTAGVGLLANTLLFRPKPDPSTELDDE